MKLEIEKCRDGNDTLKIDGYYIHSKYDPIKEAKTIVEKEYVDNYIHIIFGAGLGYVVNELKNKNNDVKFLVVEPLTDLFKENNISVDYEVVNLTDFKSSLKKACDIYNREFKVISNTNYKNLFIEDYKELLQMVKDVQKDHQVQENTIRRFSKYWEENYTKNLATAYNDYHLGSLKQAYNCPIVIASGGPSLNKQLSALKKVRKNIILIAAGSTINSLLRNDITPDYVVSIDGDEENHYHFKNLKLEDTELIYSLSSKYEIQREFKGKRLPFLTYNDLFVKSLINKELGIDFLVLHGGASVATFALSAAKHLTSGPIALIGQDLAYTNNESHAKDNKYHKAIDEDHYRSIGAFEVEGYNGSTVLTDYSFASMKFVFEELELKLPHSNYVFNCTEGGAKLKHYKQIKFQEFIQVYVDTTVDISRVEAESISNHSAAEIVGFFENEITLLGTLKKECENALDSLKVAKHSKNYSKKTLKKLDKVDTKLREGFNLVRMNRIFDPIIVDVLRNFNSKLDAKYEDKFLNVYNQNYVLYTNLIEAIDLSISYNKETIELLEGRTK